MGMAELNTQYVNNSALKKSLGVREAEGGDQGAREPITEAREEAGSADPRQRCPGNEERCTERGPAGLTPMCSQNKAGEMGFQEHFGFNLFYGVGVFGINH